MHAGPTVTAGGTVSFTGGGSPVVLNSGLAVADPDSAGNLIGAKVVIGGFISGDTLTVGSAGGLTSSFSNGTLGLSGTASLATYQTALESVAYGFSTPDGDPTGGGAHTSRTISWSVDDGVASSTTATSSLHTVHAGPSVTAGAAVAYDSGSAPVALDAGLVVTDPDSGGLLTGATVTIGAGFLAGDTLTVGTAGGLTTSFSNGTLTLSGSASIATYQTALNSVGYSFAPAATDPTDGGTDTSRTIGWTVNDGVATASASSSVAVDAIYNRATASLESTGAGTLSGSGASYTLDLGTVTQGGTPVTGILELLNAASGLADTLSAAPSLTGAVSDFTNSGIGAIGPLSESQASGGLDISLNTATAGTFTETLTLALTSTDINGSTVLTPVSIQVTGTVAAQAGVVDTLTGGTDTITGGSAPTTVIAQNGQLSAGDSINAGTNPANTLELQGAGSFNLSAPSALTGIQTITAREGQSGYASGGVTYASNVQTVTLRAGMNATLNVAQRW